MKILNKGFFYFLLAIVLFLPEFAFGVICHQTGAVNSLRTIKFSPDSKKIAVAAGQCVRQYSRRDGRLLRTIKNTTQVYGLAYRPDGLLLATGDSDSQVKIWQSSSGKLLEVFNQKQVAIDTVSQVFFSQDGKAIYALQCGAGLRKWHILSKRLLQQIRAGCPSYAALSFNNQWLALGYWGNYTIIFDAQNGKQSYRFNNFKNPLAIKHNQNQTVYALAFNISNDYLLMASDNGRATVWQFSQNKQAKFSKLMPVHVKNIAVSQNKNLFYLLDAQTLSAWNLAVGKRTKSFAGKYTNTTAVALSPNNQWLALGTDKGWISIINTTNGRVVQRVKVKF